MRAKLNEREKTQTPLKENNSREKLKKAQERSELPWKKMLTKKTVLNTNF